MTYWGDSGGFMDDEDENEAYATVASWEVGRDGLIFLIDTTKPMFTKDQNEDDTPFEICMKCIRNVLMSKIISSDKDLVGVIFFGTSKHKNSSDFLHVYSLQDLDMPDANRILEIETMESSKTFEKDFGHCDSFSLSDALWACSNMFAKSTYKLAQKRILLFTSTDDPHSNNNELKKRARKKSKDLSGLDIGLELLHMKQGNVVFDVTRFYQSIVDDEEFDVLADPSEKFDELLTRVRMKEQKKRAITRLPFKMADGISFGVSVYSLNRQVTKGSYVKVDSRTNEEVKCVTKYICQDTGQELLPTDIKLYQEFGGAKVVYEKEEVAQMKSLVEPGFHLLGFKPKSCLKLYHHVKAANFVYPDESNITGSTNLFAALLKRCLAKNVMPICIVVSRLSTPPRFVTLLPQSEELDEHRVQIKPPGFHLIYLPYSDDIRKVKVESQPKATDEQIDKAKEIIDKLKFKYSYDMFENPAIQNFYRCLEAFALDRDEVEEFTDLTLPDTQAMERKAGTEIANFKDLVYPDGYDPTNSGKRKAPSSNSGTASKKAKTDIVDINMKEVHEKGNLNKLTVSNLKTFCTANKIKLSSSAKKADIIKAVDEYFLNS